MVHHRISETALHKSGEQWQGIFSGLTQLCAAPAAYFAPLSGSGDPPWI